MLLDMVSACWAHPGFEFSRRGHRCVRLQLTPIGKPRNFSSITMGGADQRGGSRSCHSAPDIRHSAPGPAGDGTPSGGQSLSRTTTGLFLTGVIAPAQCGPNLLGLTTYLLTFRMLPIDRIRRLCDRLFGRAPSARTNLNATERVAGDCGGCVRYTLYQLHERRGRDGRARGHCASPA